MTKFSLGDFAINEQASEYNSDAPFTLEDFDKKETNIESVKDKKPEDVQNFIPIQKNEDGSLKYSFDNIYQNKQANTLRANKSDESAHEEQGSVDIIQCLTSSPFKKNVTKRKELCKKKVYF